VYWKRLVVTKLEEYFLGDLFTNSAYSNDVLYQFTKKTLQDIEEKIKSDNRFSFKPWKISFYIYNIKKVVDETIEITFL
jgi:hypothetical protein